LAADGMFKRSWWVKREVVVCLGVNERKQRRVAVEGAMAAVGGLCCGKGDTKFEA
jgi:hypothetical protein